MTTNNPHRGEVKVRLRKANGSDEEDELVMRPTFAAVVEIEQTLDKGLVEVMRRFGLGGRGVPSVFSMFEASVVLAAGLRAGGYNIPREELGPRLMATGLSELHAPLVAFLSNCWLGGKSEIDPSLLPPSSQ